MDYLEQLRRLAINDEWVAGNEVVGLAIDPVSHDQKTLALARIAALVAVGGPGPSFGFQIDAAVSAGATAREIVDVVVGIIPVTGLPRVAAAAPRVAMALGHDLDDDVVESPQEQ